MARLRYHEKDYKKYLSGKFHRCGSFETLENGNYDIINILAFSCNNLLELRQKEQEIMDLYPEAVNINRAYNSEEDKRKIYREKSRQYLKENPEKCRQNCRKSRSKNRAEYNKISQEYMTKRREYQQSWGGDPRYNNCSLLKIDPYAFLV